MWLHPGEIRAQRMQKHSPVARARHIGLRGRVLERIWLRARQGVSVGLNLTRKDSEIRKVHMQLCAQSQPVAGLKNRAALRH